MRAGVLVAVCCCCLLLVQAKTAKQQEEQQQPADETPNSFDPSVLGSVLAYLTTDNQSYVNDLLAFAAIPSISALPDHSNDVLAAAGWLKQRMLTAGLANVQVLPTKGAQPVVSVTAVACSAGTDTYTLCFVSWTRQETVWSTASPYSIRHQHTPPELHPAACAVSVCRFTVTGCTLAQINPLC